MTDGNLPGAVTRLQDVVSAVIDPKPQYYEGSVRWSDSLYAQIRAAVRSMRKGSSSNTFGSSPPGWIDAMDALGDIDREAFVWEPRSSIYPYHPRLDTKLRIQIVSSRSWRPQDCTDIDRISSWLESWVKRVDRLFAPEPVKHIVAPCPACGVRWVYRDDAGERVRQPALQITTAGCSCQHCRHTWLPEYFTHLARVLGYGLPEGVLE